MNDKPLVKKGSCYDPEIDKKFRVGSKPWFSLLEDIQAFRFEDAFTARKEKRPTSKKQYWYAWRRVNNRLRKLYLGSAEELTLERLEEIAQEINQPDEVFWANRVKQKEPKDERSELKAQIRQLKSLIDEQLIEELQRQLEERPKISNRKLIRFLQALITPQEQGGLYNPNDARDMKRKIKQLLEFLQRE